MQFEEPICYTRKCKHFGGIEVEDSDSKNQKAWAVCDAFPDNPGIPMEIMDGTNDHTNPFPGDHGIQYEPEET